MEKILDPNICGWDTSVYLIFSNNVFGNFIYYSHLFPALTALIFGIFIFRSNPRGNLNRLLLIISIVFTFWSLFDLVLWATEKTHFTMFFWSVLIHFDLLLYILSFYFIYVFMKGTLPNWKIDLTLLVLYIPIVLFSHTTLNLSGFDFTNCFREALEGPLWQRYVYNVELLIAFAIFVFGVFQIYSITDTRLKRERALALTAVLLFLLSFSFGNILGSINVDWELGQYGLFGMPIFVGILAYLTARYGTFSVTVLVSQVLVASLVVLIISLLFVPKIVNVRIIAAVTCVLTIAIGRMLLLNIRRDLEQRKQIEKLAESLKTANERLKLLDKMKSEFVSIASHQLRSPLTSIRGYASMLAEGSYGKLPARASGIVQSIADSAKYMALSVEDYLNVSRIEAGNMKYELCDFNLKEVAAQIADEIRPLAIKKGLVVLFRSDCSGSCVIHADIGKTRQIITNLVDNAMKYTQKGTITILAHDNLKKKKLCITIKDTGVGMSKQTLEDVFEKFVRAKNANNINVTGTGLGLYVAKKMITSMGGRIWAESEGEGKGSTFTIEFNSVDGPRKG